jgi:hypothetical protein
MKKIYIVIIILFLSGCSTNRFLSQGYVEHENFLRLINGENNFELKTINLKDLKIVIVDDQVKMPCIYNYEKGREFVGCAVVNAYSNTIYVKGKKTKNGLVVSPSVIGHELIHIIEGGDIMLIHDYDKIKD